MAGSFSLSCSVNTAPVCMDEKYGLVLAESWGMSRFAIHSNRSGPHSKHGLHKCTIGSSTSGVVHGVLGVHGQMLAVHYCSKLKSRSVAADPPLVFQT